VNEHLEPQQSDDRQEVKFHGWRLLGIIFLVVAVIAGVSAIIDLVVIGPIDGRIS
jgi:hypothetical protein